MPLVRAMLCSRRLRILFKFLKLARPVSLGVVGSATVLAERAGLLPLVVAAAFTVQDISM